MGRKKSLQDLKISDREKHMIKHVLDKYDMAAKEIYKIRSAYKVTTNKGAIALKRLKHGHKKALRGNYLSEGLIASGFINTIKFIKTEKGELSVKYNNHSLYVTEWIEGEECNLDSLSEAVSCSKFLAEFHQASNKIEIRAFKAKNNLKNWPHIFSSSLSDLEKFKSIIERKKIKNEFDNIYYEYIDSYYEKGMKALNILNSSDYYRLSKMASSHKTLCHDSFYYQNIIKKGEEYYIIDLDSLLIDLQVMNLEKFIRRLMCKREYKWDFDKAKYMIEAYDSVKQLTLEELEVMLALIIFPHKFWKLGKKRYIKMKGWHESKYMHKLGKIIEFSEQEEKFFTDYLNYIYR